MVFCVWTGPAQPGGLRVVATGEVLEDLGFGGDESGALWTRPLVCPSFAASRVTTFLLVHGAFHGGWVWDRVAPLLRSKGHDVFTPTLTGLDGGTQPSGGLVGLMTHIDDLVDILDREDLHDTVVVGHSYGGLPVTGACWRRADRIQTLVYLDAVFPLPGDTNLGYLPSNLQAQLLGSVERSPFGDVVPCPSPAAFGITDPEDLAWVASRLVPQPLWTFREPLPDRPPVLPRVDLVRLYLLCRDQAGRTAMKRHAERAAEAGVRVIELHEAHDLMVTNPEKVTDVLAAISGDSERSVGHPDGE